MSFLNLVDEQSILLHPGFGHLSSAHAAFPSELSWVLEARSYFKSLLWGDIPHMTGQDWHSRAPFPTGPCPPGSTGPI